MRYINQKSQSLALVEALNFLFQVFLSIQVLGELETAQTLQVEILVHLLDFDLVHLLRLEELLKHQVDVGLVLLGFLFKRVHCLSVSSWPKEMPELEVTSRILEYFSNFSLQQVWSRQLTLNSCLSWLRRSFVKLWFARLMRNFAYSQTLPSGPSPDRTASRFPTGSACFAISATAPSGNSPPRPNCSSSSSRPNRLIYSNTRRVPDSCQHTLDKNVLVHMHALLDPLEQKTELRKTLHSQISANKPQAIVVHFLFLNLLHLRISDSLLSQPAHFYLGSKSRNSGPTGRISSKNALIISNFNSKIYSISSIPPFDKMLFIFYLVSIFYI